MNGLRAPDRRLLMDRSVPGRSAVRMPLSDVPPADLPDASLLRDDLELPEVSQLELVRYFTLLSQLNFSIDTNFYPLGSCTMKYNPKLNDEVASLPGFSQIHPAQPDDTAFRARCDSCTSYKRCSAKLRACRASG